MERYNYINIIDLFYGKHYTYFYNVIVRQRFSYPQKHIIY